MNLQYLYKFVDQGKRGIAIKILFTLLNKSLPKSLLISQGRNLGSGALHGIKCCW